MKTCFLLFALSKLTVCDVHTHFMSQNKYIKPKWFLNGSIAPSDGLELAENYIRWPRPTAEQGQLQASQAKISGFSIWWPAVKLTSSSVPLDFFHPADPREVT